MTETSATKRLAKRGRKPTNFALAWVTESEPEVDAHGAPIPGSERQCFVLMDLPPGLDEAGKRSRDAIERACRKAVYEDQRTEYGNKRLVVLSYGDFFSVDYERVTVTKLLPPDKAEQVRAENGRDVVTGPLVEDDEISSYDDEDDDDTVD